VTIASLLRKQPVPPRVEAKTRKKKHLFPQVNLTIAHSGRLVNWFLKFFSPEFLHFSRQPRGSSSRTPGSFFRVEKGTKKTLKKLRFLRIFLNDGVFIYAATFCLLFPISAPGRWQALPRRPGGASSPSLSLYPLNFRKNASNSPSSGQESVSISPLPGCRNRSSTAWRHCPVSPGTGFFAP